MATAHTVQGGRQAALPTITVKPSIWLSIGHCKGAVTRDCHHLEQRQTRGDCCRTNNCRASGWGGRTNRMEARLCPLVQGNMKFGEKHSKGFQSLQAKQHADGGDNTGDDSILLEPARLAES